MTPRQTFASHWNFMLMRLQGAVTLLNELGMQELASRVDADGRRLIELRRAQDLEKLKKGLRRAKKA